MKILGQSIVTRTGELGTPTVAPTPFKSSPNPKFFTYSFGGWTPTLPSTFTGNLSFKAKWIEEPASGGSIPPLPPGGGASE